MRLARAAALSLVGALAAAPVGGQTVTFSIGPVIRALDEGTSTYSHNGFAYAFDAALGFRISPAVSLRVGGGVLMTHDPNVVFAPLPPGATPCGCDASEQLYLGRVGLSFERGRFLVGSGAVVADGGSDSPRRFGGFAELRVRPFKGSFDVGVLAYQLFQSTGRHRAVVMPALGLRF